MYVEEKRREEKKHSVFALVSGQQHREFPGLCRDYSRGDVKLNLILRSCRCLFRLLVFLRRRLDKLSLPQNIAKGLPELGQARLPESVAVNSNELKGAAFQILRKSVDSLCRQKC